jgi:tetratricopeptide (TPR) repeat protein
MRDQGRVLLLYRRRKCGAHPERVLAALDERYRECEVSDFGLDDDAALSQFSGHVRVDDVVLVLGDPEWQISIGEIGPASTVWVGLDGSMTDARLAIHEETWEADIQRVLDELDVLLADVSEPAHPVRTGGEDMDELFDEAVALQKSGKHEDAIDLFLTIVRSRTPGVAGRAAYAAGRSFEKVQDSNHAIQAYREAISLGPQEAAAAAAYGLALLLQRRREFEEAAVAFAQAAELGDGPMRARAEELRDRTLRKAAQA